MDQTRDSGDLVAFLAARLDEDEALASAAEEFCDGNWWPDPGVISDSTGLPDYRHIKHCSPARSLREVKAKRAILAEWRNPEWVRDPRQDPEMRWSIEQGLFQEGRDPDEIKAQVAEAEAIDYVIRILAAIYGDHPDYRPEWSPDAR